MPKVNVRIRPETGALYFDFFHRGIRCREQTALASKILSITKRKLHRTHP